MSTVLTPRDKVIIEYLFKYVELSKSLFEAAAESLKIERKDMEESVLDIYKSSKFLDYQDNYEWLQEVVEEPGFDKNQEIIYLGDAWRFIPHEHDWGFVSEKMHIRSNFVNVNFINPEFFADFLKASLPGQPEFDIPVSDMETMFRIYRDKQYLVQAENKASDTTWVKADYMINYEYFLEIAKKNLQV